MTDLDALLARAEAGARQRRHETVGPEHLLAAILDEDVVNASLARRGLDRDELRERLAARLSTRPIGGGYRGHVALVRAPTLERVIERLAPRSWLRRAESPTVLDALLLEPWIASLVLGLRKTSGGAGLLERAVALAVVRGNPVVTVEHVLATMLDDETFRDAVAAVGGGRDRVRAAVGAALAKQRPVPELGERPALSHALGRAYAPKIAAKSFVVRLFRRAEAKAALAAGEADEFTLSYVMTHGELPLAPTQAERASHEIVDVFVHWDPVTPREAVERILRPAFDLVGDESAHVVLRMETEGSALIRRMTMRDAAECVDRAALATRRDGLPIRFSLRRL